jgi:hypothetical protein
VRVPVLVGVNVTFTVQVPPLAASVVMQLFVCAKSPVAAPIVSGVDPVPVLVTVKDILPLVVPTVCDGKVKLGGAGVTMTVVPLPDKVTLCGEVDALSVMVTVPGRLPLVVGANVTLTVQVTPPPNEVPQLLVWP